VKIRRLNASKKKRRPPENLNKNLKMNKIHRSPLSGLAEEMPPQR